MRFHPDIKECDKAGVHIIVNDDTKPIPFETVSDNFASSRVEFCQNLGEYIQTQITYNAPE